MTKNEKKLMALTLTHMLDYGVKCKINGEGDERTIVSLEEDPKHALIVLFDDGSKVPLNDIVPILIPMDGLTKEEAFELHDLGGIIKYDSDSGKWQTMPLFTDLRVLDWFESHFIDYRGLIDRGIAIPKER